MSKNNKELLEKKWLLYLKYFKAVQYCFNNPNFGVFDDAGEKLDCEGYEFIIDEEKRTVYIDSISSRTIYCDFYDDLEDINNKVFYPDNNLLLQSLKRIPNYVKNMFSIYAKIDDCLDSCVKKHKKEAKNTGGE